MMDIIAHLGLLFLAKVTDNALSTAKTILIQRNRCLIAGVTLAASNYIGYWIIRSMIVSDGNAAMIIVSVASGVGCCLAMLVSSRLSRDRTYVNVILSDNKAAMQDFRDFLAQHHITNVATDSYTRNWAEKTISITAYPETRAENQLISDYIDSSPLKFKRLIQKAQV